MLSRFEKYLRHGFYPFYTTETEQNYLVRVNNLITSVIDYDVTAVERVEYETLRKAKHLLNLVGGGGGSGFGFADGGVGEVDADDCGAVEASRYRFVESVHVFGEKALADQAQSFGFLFRIVNERGAAESYG